MKAPFLKLAVQVLGMALIISGGLWALQGAGILMWPSDSIMLADRNWAFYGAVTAALGALLLLFSRRIGRP